MLGPPTECNYRSNLLLRFWHGLVTFGCAITIPDEEAAETRELLTSALIAASLGNDLFSYEKEYEDTMRAGLPDVVNAIWVIMGEHGCTEQEAKEICKERSKYLAFEANSPALFPSQEKEILL